MNCKRQQASKEQAEKLAKIAGKMYLYNGRLRLAPHSLP